MKPLYQSTAVMEVVVHSGGDPFSNDNILASQQLAQAETDLATTDSVLGEVASNYSGLSADDLAKEVTATLRANTQLFQIDVLDPSPTQAANLANGIAAVLISQQLQVTHQVTQQTPGQGAVLIVVQPARPALSPARPNKLIYIGAGLLIGLLLGILLAVLFELLGTRVRTGEAITQLLDWPVLATLRKTGHKKEVVNLVGYNSNTRSYSTLKTNIGFAMADKPLRTLVVTSSTPGEGKSVVAANLAIQMAKAGQITLLIDANLRHPTLHEQFSIPAYAMGFSNAILAFRASPPNVAARREIPASNSGTRSSNASDISGKLSLAHYVRGVGIPNLWVMPSGLLPPNPSELLDSKAMQSFCLALSNSTCELVIFDAPSLIGLPDATILASKVDATLIVVDTTCARKKDLKQAKALLEQARVHVLGCVLNKHRRRHEDMPYKDIAYGYGPRNSSYDSAEKRDLTTFSPDSSVIQEPSETSPQPNRVKQNGKAEHDTNNVDSSTPSKEVADDDKEQTIEFPLVKKRRTGE
jgi:non-specific protein-tyrosine kinase